MYVHPNIVAGLRDYCNGNAITCSCRVVVNLPAAANKIKQLSGAMETEQPVIFALM
jgi:hypothetical protein